MKKLSLYFIIPFILTLFASRVFLHFSPQTNIIILGKTLHHFYLGIILLILVLPFALFYTSKIRTYALVFLGISLALIVDEFSYLAFTNGSDLAYSQAVSFNGMLVLGLFILAYYFFVATSSKTF